MTGQPLVSQDSQKTSRYKYNKQYGRYKQYKRSDTCFERHGMYTKP